MCHLFLCLLGESNRGSCNWGSQNTMLALICLQCPCRSQLTGGGYCLTHQTPPPTVNTAVRILCDCHAISQVPFCTERKLCQHFRYNLCVVNELLQNTHHFWSWRSLLILWVFSLRLTNTAIVCAAYLYLPLFQVPVPLNLWVPPSALPHGPSSFISPSSSRMCDTPCSWVTALRPTGRDTRKLIQLQRDRNAPSHYHTFQLQRFGKFHLPVHINAVNNNKNILFARSCVAQLRWAPKCVLFL